MNIQFVSASVPHAAPDYEVPASPAPSQEGGTSTVHDEDTVAATTGFAEVDHALRLWRNRQDKQAISHLESISAAGPSLKSASCAKMRLLNLYRWLSLSGASNEKYLSKEIALSRELGMSSNELCALADLFSYRLIGRSLQNYGVSRRLFRLFRPYDKGCLEAAIKLIPDALPEQPHNVLKYCRMFLTYPIETQEKEYIKEILSAHPEEECPRNIVTSIRR